MIRKVYAVQFDLPHDCWLECHQYLIENHFMVRVHPNTFRPYISKCRGHGDFTEEDLLVFSLKGLLFTAEDIGWA